MYVNRGLELPLTPVGPQPPCPPVRAEVRLPDDRDAVTLEFEVGWERCGYAPSAEESWDCYPFRIRFAGPGDPETEVGPPQGGAEWCPF